MPGKAIPLARAGWIVWVTVLLMWIVVPLVAGAPPGQRPPVTPGPRPPASTPTRPHSDKDESSGADKKDEVLIGAFIELHVSASPAGARAAPPGAWSVVQWQDDAGGWHAVEGWQGTIETPGQKVWWVAHRDFGAGPFRWVLHARQGGPLLATSHPFYLPTAANETVSVVVSLGARPGTAAGQPAPAPTAAPPGSAWLPTTGAPLANAWPSIILVLGLLIGGGLLLNHAKTRW
jgi:hypothetical protein